MLSPKISIIIPLYNRSNLILETLDSVIIQTTKNFQCIIIDDHSTDNSFALVQNYIKNDKRFILKKRISKIKGAPKCRNEGIDSAISNYIMFLDSDDLLDPICLEQRLVFIEQVLNKDFYVFKVALFNPENYQAHFLCGNMNVKNDLDGFINYTGGWHTSSTVFRKNFLKNNHYFDEEAQSWQDVEFHIRALLKTKNYLKFITSQPDVYVRIADHSRISNTNWSYQKIFQRINSISKIEAILSFEDKKKYQKQIFLFYFRYLEFSARNLNLVEYSNLKYFSKLKNRVFTKSEFVMIKYLDLQNFLQRKNYRQIGSIVYRIIRLFYSKQLAFPQKKIKLKQAILIKARFRQYN